MAGKGGGAWKVAYADFVTAMMAFFLVMWLCGQDQQVKRAVSYYFVDPVGASLNGAAKKPVRTGAVSDLANAGSLPESESVAMGRGRNSHTAPTESSPATKLLSSWLHADKATTAYWRNQGARQRERARWARDVGERAGTVDTIATQLLAKQLRDEVTRGIPAQAKGIYQDLLFDTLSGVNWIELAEDLLSDH